MNFIQQLILKDKKNKLITQLDLCQHSVQDFSLLPTDKQYTFLLLDGHTISDYSGINGDSTILNNAINGLKNFLNLNLAVVKVKNNYMQQSKSFYPVLQARVKGNDLPLVRCGIVEGRKIGKNGKTLIIISPATKFMKNKMYNVYIKDESHSTLVQLSENDHLLKKYNNILDMPENANRTLPSVDVSIRF